VTSLKTSPCKGCGKPIVWARVDDEHGGAVPLDPRPPVYIVNVLSSGDVRCVRAARESFMVSHFATCPKANEFGGGKRS